MLAVHWGLLVPTEGRADSDDGAPALQQPASAASELPTLPLVLLGSGLASFGLSGVSLTQIAAATDSIQRFCGPEESCGPNIDGHYIAGRRTARNRWRATLVGSGLLGIGLMGTGVFLWIDHEAQLQAASAERFIGVAAGPEHVDVSLRLRF